MRIRLLAVAAVTAALVSAAPAAADPNDWVPYCSGAETPALNHCRIDCPNGEPVLIDTGKCNVPGVVPMDKPQL